MNDDDGLTLAISPVQLAAILRRGTVSEGETLSNRLWGGVGVLGGVAEIFGAGVLCVVPEPTMLTKAGCVVVGSHSLDTLNTSIKQLWTGRRMETATAQLAEKAASQFGADPEMAYKIGATVDLIVPIGFASLAGASRVASIYSGRIRLVEHEGGALGHTIARHVAQTPEQLIARLSGARAPNRASTFRSVKEAELIISEILSVKRSQIEAAVKYLRPGSKLPLEHRFSFSVGNYIDKGSTELKKAYSVRVILKAQSFNGKLYFILTAYPAA